MERNKGVFWSTPIQSHHDSGYGDQDTFGYNIDVSPIGKKTPCRSNLAFTLKQSCDSEIELNKKTTNNVKKVNRKLSFTNSFHENETVYSSQDSGIQSMYNTFDKIEMSENSSNSGNQTQYDILQSFPTDLNCDIQEYINRSNNKLNQYKEYVCEELFYKHLCNTFDVHSSQLLDKNNTVDCVFQGKRKYVFAIDILNELSLRNCTSILSQIMSYISDEDLRKCSYVSRNWQYIIFSDQKANTRRINYINNRRSVTKGPNKENRFQTKCLAERNHKSVFLSIVNVPSQLPQQSLYNDNLVGKFDSFCQEVKSLQDKDSLMKCPKCNYPSKIEFGSKYFCTRNLCQYEFCKKCLGPFLDNHFCSLAEFNNTIPSTIIGSKKSKKFLRRLKKG